QPNETAVIMSRYSSAAAEYRLSSNAAVRQQMRSGNRQRHTIQLQCRVRSATPEQRVVTVAVLLCRHWPTATPVVAGGPASARAG
ncbi:MAG: hypothetical protein ACKPJD_09155, partial [Planctomycetaceae bacterium]